MSYLVFVVLIFSLPPHYFTHFLNNSKCHSIFAWKFAIHFCFILFYLMTNHCNKNTYFILFCDFSPLKYYVGISSSLVIFIRVHFYFKKYNCLSFIHILLLLLLRLHPYSPLYTFIIHRFFFIGKMIKIEMISKKMSWFLKTKRINSIKQKLLRVWGREKKGKLKLFWIESNYERVFKK